MVDAAAAPAATQGCPFHAAAAKPALGPTGCPISAEAAAFDVFDSPFQPDPAEALRWARAQEPVFYSPRTGYWVVARYDDVKAVFRDNESFSPQNALEKVTPFVPEAQAVLERYNYAMNRTLVNEDEPAHLERRRALMHSFIPTELEHHVPMVRKLARDYVDRLVDRGEADLVDEMLWEIPLTVALHFLGIPESDMQTLRRYSVAHSVNTWGRPSPDQQMAVAESVGKFWQLAGDVLERMRQNPSGHGWMEYAIRVQRELPEVVTDSYLHSMMMAGLVAAHETSALASANALRLLLSRRDVWNALCRDASLIPNAVEECLRLSGSIVAWRRVALMETVVGGVTIPQGARLLIVMNSANHDERHFENPDELDIYRDNTTDHLSFGYGSHQCMGKNVARMEIRIFLEELTRRLPHMELVPEQDFASQPNISFRGPEHLLVRWDPAQNPERQDPSRRQPRMDFPIGAPRNRDLARSVTVTGIETVAEDIILLTLKYPGQSTDGRALPGWSPGAHIDVIAGPYSRKYSLCGDPARSDIYQIAILKDPASRGGSAYLHDAVAVGDVLRIRGPKNHFRLDETAEDYILVAGGIGITPIIAIADRLKSLGRRYHLHYAGRTEASMALLDRLARDHGDNLTLHIKQHGGRLSVAAIVAQAQGGAQIYACGPENLLNDLAAQMVERAEQLHIEHFAATGSQLDPSREIGFDVRLQDTGLTLHVAPDQTLLDALWAAGIDVTSDCGEGLCGTCEVRVVAGEVEHRDRVLSAAERRCGDRIMACCSRAKGGELVLAV
ncbi:MAG: cytochrome P450/oxidoreductase [Acetobacteraceae bacterium]|nr:cytochrome P450/oxidoreductase [Acetobacteraceae bacterium]